MDLPRITKFLLIIIFFFFLIVQISFGANVFVPSMELASRMYLSSLVETRLNFQIAMDGGQKYRGKLFFQCYNTDIERSSPPVLTFDGAQVTIRDVFNILDLTYWTGYYGILGEGKHYKGYLYHWDSGFDYNGYRPILGTGFIASVDYYDLLNGQLFVYRRIGSVKFNSIDLNFGLDKDPIIFKLFSGLSDNIYVAGPNPIFRIGTQFIYLGEIIELYLTAGDPAIETGKGLSFDDFYLLLEEWFIINNWKLILSVFTRPKEHYSYIERNYISTGETNDIDFNFDLNYEPEARYFSIGGAFNVQTNNIETLGVFFSPYINIFASGLAGKIKLDINILSKREELVTGYVVANISF